MFQTFVFLLAPICTNIRDSDFEQNLRLQNGRKIWQAMWEYSHPDIACFKVPVSPNSELPHNLSSTEKWLLTPLSL